MEGAHGSEGVAEPTFIDRPKVFWVSAEGKKKGKKEGGV